MSGTGGAGRSSGGARALLLGCRLAGCILAGCILAGATLAGCTSPPPPPPFAARLIRPDDSTSLKIGELVFAMAHGLAVSRDGERAATFSYGTLTVRDVADGATVLSYSADPARVRSVLFGATNDRFFVSVDDGTIHAFDSVVHTDEHSGRSEQILQGKKDAVAHLRLSPDGGTLLSWENDAIAWDLATRTARTRIEGPCVAVTQDASAVLVKRTGLALVDARTGLARWTSGEPASAAAFSDDGSLVAIGTIKGAVELREAASGAILARALGFDGGVRSFVFSPDRRFLVAGGRGLDSDRLLELPSLKDVRLLRWQRGVHAFSPDSSLLASIVGGQWAVLTETKTGRELAELYAGPRHRELYESNTARDVLDYINAGMAQAWRLAFSPDGRFLIVQNGIDGDPTIPSEIRFFDVVQGKKLALVEGSDLVFTKGAKTAIWLRAQDGIICVGDAPP